LQSSRSVAQKACSCALRLFPPCATLRFGGSFLARLRFGHAPQGAGAGSQLLRSLRSRDFFFSRIASARAGVKGLRPPTAVAPLVPRSATLDCCSRFGWVGN